MALSNIKFTSNRVHSAAFARGGAAYFYFGLSSTGDKNTFEGCSFIDNEAVVDEGSTGVAAGGGIAFYYASSSAGTAHSFLDCHFNLKLYPGIFIVLQPLQKPVNLTRFLRLDVLILSTALTNDR